MDRAAILEWKQRLVEEHGEWTAHNIRLGEGIYTLGERIYGDEYRLRRVLQVVSDVVDRPFRELRVLDLACLEGLYSIEFGLHGAEVLGIEARASHVAKALFAKEVLRLDSVAFVQDDVRNLSREHGEFDIVLCIGILYHLDASDVFDLVARIGEVCTKVALVDTHIALSPRSSREHRGHIYHGLTYVEHSAASSMAMRERSPWASLDNPESFWPTKPSLLNAAARAGFTTVSECKIPALLDEPGDRLMLVLIKGSPQAPLATVGLPETEEVPESSRRRPIFSQLRGAPLVTRTVLAAKAHVDRLSQRGP